jgi:TRAP-type C4-dicarboxylate transport system permease small subunit
MIRDRHFALAFRIASFLLTLAGLLDIFGVWRGAFNPRQFMYYTIQSNILALAYFGLLAWKTALSLKQGDGRAGNAGSMPRFGLIVAIDTMLTLVAYWLLLAPSQFAMSSSSFNMWGFANIAVHLLAPLLCFLDFILFAGTKSLKYKDIYLVLIYPLAYVLFTSLAGLLGYRYATPSGSTRFAYFFLDFDKIGAQVFVYMIALIVFFLILAHLIYLFDNKVDKEGIFRRGKGKERA